MLADYALTETGKGGLGLQPGRGQGRARQRGVAAGGEPGRACGARGSGGCRRAPGDRPETTEYVVLARLSTDPPLTDPESFRSLLNSFLPRKRAIGQLLVRDEAERVLLCQLTYKRDWDLPGGVVEVGESPRHAVVREVAEELGLDR